MRRLRISTWVLAAIFVVALVVYILVKPSSASIIGTPPRPASHTPPASHTRPATQVPGLPLPGTGTTGSPSPSPSGSIR
jgi:hypothetical protein